MPRASRRRASTRATSTRWSASKSSTNRSGLPLQGARVSLLAIRGGHMRTAALFAAALAALPAPQPALAADAIRVEPTSQWVLDYADEHCTLARAFGSGDSAA